MASTVEKGLLLNGVSVNSADELDPTGPSFAVVTASPNNTYRVTGFPLDATGNTKLGVGGSGSLLASSFSHSTGTWTSKDPLPTTGTELGEAMVIGDNGFYFGGITDQTAIQQNLIASDTWSDVATLSMNFNYGAVFRSITDANVGVISGGVSGQVTTKLFDATTLTDSAADNHPRSLYAHHGVNSDPLNGNYGYTVGGQSGANAECDRYDFAADAWTGVGNVSYSAGASGVSGPMGQVWSCGGGGNLQTTSVMDVSAETWSAGTSLSGNARRALGCVGYTVFGLGYKEANFSHWESWQSATSSAAAVNKTGDALRWMGPGLNLAFTYGGEVGSAAQSTIWSYNPIAGTWDSGLASGATGQRGAAFSDGTDLWATRGEESVGVQKYDISADSWAATGNLAAIRIEPAYSDGFDGKGILTHGALTGGTSQITAYSLAYATGLWTAETSDTGFAQDETSGFCDWDDTHYQVAGTGVSKQVRKYSVAGDTWEAGDLPAINRALHDCCSLQVTSRGYVMGGSPDGLKTMESIDFTGGDWHIHALSSSNHASNQLTVFDNSIHVVGGSTAQIVESYDHATDAWASETSTPAVRDGHRGGSHDQHTWNRSALTDYSSQTFTATGLTQNTVYYFDLWAHDLFYGPA